MVTDSLRIVGCVANELNNFFLRSGVVLEKVCEYLYYNQKNKDAKDVPDMEIPQELCLELLMAADYLDGKLHSFEVVYGANEHHSLILL